MTALTFIATLNPEQKLEAVRRMPADDASSGLLWVVLSIALAVIIVATAVLVILAARAQRRRQAVMMHQEALRLGLSEDEAELLDRLVGVSGTSEPMTLLAVGQTFHAAAERYREGRIFQGLPHTRQAETEALIARLAEKLGFDDRGDEEEASEDAGPFQEGGALSVVHRGAADGRQARIVDVHSDDIVVESDLPPESVKIGENWLIRYPNDGTVWEFDATVLRSEGGRHVLSRPARLRFVNHRRFQRAATDQAVQVAAFSGLKAGEPELPRFVPGRMLEIGGPGVRVRADLDAAVGQSVLALLQVAPDTTLEALGKVRRVLSQDDGAPLLAIELVGLTRRELAELVRLTNHAARKARCPADKASAEEAAV